LDSFDFVTFRWKIFRGAETIENILEYNFTILQKKLVFRSVVVAITC
jgi:hypothetical protein